MSKYFKHVDTEDKHKFYIYYFFKKPMCEFAGNNMEDAIKQAKKINERLRRKVLILREIGEID